MDLRDIARKTVEEKNEERNENKYTAFVNKANEAGLSNEKLEMLWSLIIKLNKDLAERKKRKKELNTDVSLADTDDGKTPQSIKKEFQKAVTALITLKEYSQLLDRELKPKAKKDAKKQFNEILKVHELTEEQKVEILKK